MNSPSLLQTPLTHPTGLENSTLPEDMAGDQGRGLGHELHRGHGASVRREICPYDMGGLLFA